MADILDELLNSGSVDTAELAAQLRNQREHGMVGALSGSKRLAPFAANMEQQSLEQAGTAGDTRRAQSNFDSEAALNQWRAELAAQSRQSEIRARQQDNAANRNNQRGMNDARVRASRANAKLRAGNKSAASDPVSIESEALRLDDLADQADKAVGQSGFMSTGWRSLAAGIGGPGADLQERLKPLQSDAALGKLQEMKAMSRTGASGLGSVTEKEIDLLMGWYRSLSQIQSEKQLDEALGEIAWRNRDMARKLREANGRADGPSFDDGDNDDMLAAPGDDEFPAFDGEQ